MNLIRLQYRFETYTSSLHSTAAGRDYRWDIWLRGLATDWGQFADME